MKRKSSTNGFRTNKRARRTGGRLKRAGTTRGAAMRHWSSATKLTANNRYLFQRCAPSYTLEMPSTSVAYSPTFSLDQVYQYTDFYNLYDSFRIVKVELFIAMINNPNATVQPGGTSIYNATNWYPRLWYVADPSDSSSLTQETARVRQGVKYVTLQPNTIKRITISSPKLQV